MKKITVDSADFEKIIKENKIYVDKTKYLYKIVSDNTYYFLSRPRRFGKTLFIDTLNAFFAGKRELFKCLYVYDRDWNWEEYPIIRLDFNMITNTDTDKMKNNIRDVLEKTAEKYNIKITKELPEDIFRELIPELSQKYNKGVVILIDEYDKPIISNLGKDLGGERKKRLEIAKENQEFLKILYDNFKPLEPYLQLVFITGVSKFSKVSIFSTLNNLIEIDKEPVFAEIMGYTEEELDKYFEPYFDKLAENYGITVKEARDKFKRMYNGFRFTEKDVKVYNPYSTGLSLNFSRLDNYWFESGTPTFLVDLIKEKEFDITSLDEIKIDRDELKAYNIEKLELLPLLYQTGYLTIKDVEDGIIYTLGYPNFEVERGMSLNLVKAFTEDKIKTPIIHSIKKSLLNRDYEQFMEYMKSLFAGIASINIPKTLEEREHYYHSIFYLVGVLFSDNHLNVYSELLTSEGRIDMLVETEKNIFTIEFKCNQSADKAIEQIKDKNYAEKFKLKGKEIVLIGINFDTEKRNVSGFKTVNHSKRH
jgi:hypothetical protein